MSPIADKPKRRRLPHSDVRDLGEGARVQKDQLVKEMDVREQRIDRLRESSAEARELIERGLESRSWRFAHWLAQLGRRLRGRGTMDTNAFARASEILAAGETAQAARASRAARAAEGYRYLFVTGCARSGTTVTVDLLNNDSRIAIGQERYKYLRGRLRKHHFLPGYFLNPSHDETNIHTARRYRALRKKVGEGRVSVVGDKVRIRNNIEVISEMIAELEDVRFIYMLRSLAGVASSYNRRAANPNDVNWPDDNDYRKAVKDWNGSLRALRDMYDAGYGDRVLVVSYERLYSDEPGQVERLAEFIGLGPSPEIAEGLRRARRKRPELSSGEDLEPEARSYLEENADAELHAWAQSLAASQA